MTDLSISINIDNTEITQRQLAKIQELRIKHVLHEMKQLHFNMTETDSDIEYLSYEQAKEHLIAIKAQYSITQFKHLYQEPLKAADRFWQSIAQDSTGRDNLQEGRVKMHVGGISMPQLQKIMGRELDSNFAALINPEHFYSDGSLTAGQHIIETFGCFGEPTEMNLYVEKSGFKPLDPDPTYPVQINGYCALTSNNDDLNGSLRAYHQIKPTADGFDAILSAYVPSATPKEVIEGHKYHLAIEFSGLIKYAVKQSV